MAESEASMSSSNESKNKKASYKWTIEEETFLIESVKDKPHLWDIKDKYYLNKTLKNMSYQEISEKLCTTYPERSRIFDIEEVKIKFSNLRTQYRSVLKKQKRPSGSASLGILPKWKHFWNMQFLKDTMQAMPSTSSLQAEADTPAEIHNEDLTTEDILESIDQDSSVILDSPTGSPQPEITKKNSAVKRKRKNSGEIRDLAYSTLKELQNKTEDEEEIYGQYIAKVLKSFEPMKRDLCKFEFEKIIFKLRHNVDVE